MGYSADDFFDDVVKKAENLSDIVSFSADPRGLPKFLRYLITAYGNSDFHEGIYQLVDGRAFIIIEDGAKVEIRGLLPTGYELKINGQEY